MKKEEELKERELVLESQQLAKQELSQLEIFRKLVKLHENQPTFRTRTSTSIANQAYSTPLPIGYLLACLTGVTPETTVYEPAAGHGALLISSNPDLVTANEIDLNRAEFLKSLGYKVTTRNAVNYDPKQKFDIVLANPPFGSVVKDGVKQTYRIGSYTTEQIDHAIAYHAAQFIKPDGAAGFIIAGKLGSEDRRSQSYGQKSSRNFFYYLYNTYNVVLHISLAGKLYAKQGARYPIDLIVIKGKGKSQLELPSVKLPKMYESFEDLEELLTMKEPSVKLLSAQDKHNIYVENIKAKLDRLRKQQVDIADEIFELEGKLKENELYSPQGKVIRFTIENLFQKAENQGLSGIQYQNEEGKITLTIEPETVYLESSVHKKYSITYMMTYMMYKEWEWDDEDVVIYLSGFDSYGSKEFFKLYSEKMTVDYIEKHQIIDVEAGAFKESGTNIPTVILVIDKPGITKTGVDYLEDIRMLIQKDVDIVDNEELLETVREMKLQYPHHEELISKLELAVLDNSIMKFADIMSELHKLFNPNVAAFQAPKQEKAKNHNDFCLKMVLPQKTIDIYNQAIENKDVDKLVELLHPDNKNLRKHFKIVYNVKLPDNGRIQIWLPIEFINFSQN